MQVYPLFVYHKFASKNMCFRNTLSVFLISISKINVLEGFTKCNRLTQWCVYTRHVTKQDVWVLTTLQLSVENYMMKVIE